MTWNALPRVHANSRKNRSIGKRREEPSHPITSGWASANGARERFPQRDVIVVASICDVQAGWGLDDFLVKHTGYGVLPVE
jgi:hypothetical protein